ncbi:unnamed protein product [Auanema sp. JU1783]|nr:unnamed protein product [Auanema sp. JU1783]
MDIHAHLHPEYRANRYSCLQTRMCIALGCLGVGCLPVPPCLFGACLPPLPRLIPCPCNMGFQCINGGCIMARARSAKTYIPKGEINQAEPIEDPNTHFKTCCNLLDVADGCTPLCSYNNYTTESIKGSLQITSKCPMTALPQVHFCAARGADHTECCRAGNVPADCNVFCDQRAGNITHLSLQHLKCFDYLEHIKGCFLDHAVKEYYESKMQLLEPKLK